MTDTVTIGRAEYDRLVAAAVALADLEAYDRVKASLDAGDDELVPTPLADRLIDGESPLTVYRDLRGFTKSALAAASGVHRVVIADIEAGRATGSVATLAKLAAALAVTIDDLV